MMQPIYLLFGAGAVIVLIALFLKRGKADRPAPDAYLMYKQQERAEMEKALQRFVNQVKQENEAFLAEVRRQKKEIADQLAAWEHRLRTAESGLEQTSQQLRALQAGIKAGAHDAADQAKAPEHEDTLALRERYRRVFELQQEGLDSEQIAKRLGAGRGEIELILSLAAPAERGAAHE